MKAELADLLREAAKAGQIYTSRDNWKIVNDIIRCRTAALGGHLFRCTECGKEQPQYNSCRNRHCPKCQGSDIAKWLKKRADELLSVPYFHIVFTVPHDLNPAILHNKALALDILFQAAAKALQAVATRSLKGQIGFFSVLHTWGSKLEFHPHIHCVVPGVVIKGSAIKKTRKNYFLPQRKLSVVFRAVFLKLLAKADKKGRLKFYNDSDAQSFTTILSACAKTEWVVYAKKPFAGPQTVLKYLARYTHRVAISNSRIQNYSNGQVTFIYRDKTQDNARRFCCLKLSEFVRRFLLHTLPRQFVRIRHYGFLANSVRKQRLTMLKTKLGKSPYKVQEVQTPLCRCCGKPTLKHIAKILPSGSSLRKEKLLPLVA